MNGIFGKGEGLYNIFGAHELLIFGAVLASNLDQNEGLMTEARSMGHGTKGPIPKGISGKKESSPLHWKILPV
ncbi:hypothetical protein OsI_22289 [Oryza sativa Indica Group]|uniref:Uncharacterized protein n=7 Tax=Oryza TaxID=4527 RepID=Q67VP7_ORYSJ|nr:hypothetical protein OsI_22289 [Oryza sativa Indica Group]EAZ36389.1 hypothetical protein OsJ_20718 [Oryza sativa Japonica Group]BAD37772.1 hypothetical protein [Oryza sativa Japonica Group]